LDATSSSGVAITGKLPVRKSHYGVFPSAVLTQGSEDESPAEQGPGGVISRAQWQLVEEARGLPAGSERIFSEYN